jgi:hypothetical protein
MADHAKRPKVMMQLDNNEQVPRVLGSEYHTAGLVELNEVLKFFEPFILLTVGLARRRRI